MRASIATGTSYSAIPFVQCASLGPFSRLKKEIRSLSCEKTHRVGVNRHLAFASP